MGVVEAKAIVSAFAEEAVAVVVGDVDVVALAVSDN